MNNINDELAVRALVDQFVQGWNTADGAAFARPFASDADFTAITGLRARGRDLIARAHTEILTGIHRGTRLAAEVNSVRLLRPDVAVADVSTRMTPAVLGPRAASACIVAAKAGGEWSIAVFHNMIPFERALPGPIERELMSESSGAAAR